MGAITDYIRGRLQQGRHTVTTVDVMQALGRERAPVALALNRRIHKGELASPSRGFYVVVPPEYQALGCLPADQFVPQLMEHVGEPDYHAALLSAAQLHGAAHQRPQRFQVMVGRPRRPLDCGRVGVDFHVRSGLDEVGTVDLNTPRGVLRVSSPEATAVELVGYAKHAGGLDNVATVLAELAERLDAGRLVEEAWLAPLAWSQRLGYLLELVGQGEVVVGLHEHVQASTRRVAPLDVSRPRTSASRSERWRVAINTSVEADL